MPTRARLVLTLIAFVTLAMPVEAKGPIAKLVLLGPDLSEPLEITNPEATDVSIYGAGFVDHVLGPIERTSTSPISPYMVQFHVALSPDDVRMLYVVYFVWDHAERAGYVYFPGREDAWYMLNMSTVAQPGGGSWFRAKDGWGAAIQAAMVDRFLASRRFQPTTDPRTN